MRFYVRLLILAALAAAGGCAAQKQAAGTAAPAPADQTAGPAVPFDPLAMDTGDEDISFSPPAKPAVDNGPDLPDNEYVVVNVDKKAWEEEKKKALSLAEDGEHELGYRVQVITSTIMDTALALKDSIAARFTLDVYLQYDAPYYKIRVGDFIDQDEARGIADRVKSYGYKEAWVVRSEICRTCAARRTGTDILVPDSTAAGAVGDGKKPR